MNITDVRIDMADWSDDADRSALQAVRQTVFVTEQGINEAHERDGLDPDCQHVIARDAQGQVIGCARLTPAHTIGRLAVLSPWRGRGVGSALLQQLIAMARSMAWPSISLAAQVGALRLYERAGFTASGEPYEKAGLPHRDMTLSLQDASPPLAGRTAIATREEAAAARLTVLQQARRCVDIYLPILPRDQFATAEEQTELRRIATAGRGALVRILLHDPASAAANDHRLVALAQRLPTSVQIRVPVDEADLTYISSYLLDDRDGYLFFPEADRPRGRVAGSDRAGKGELSQHFNAVWERAEPASTLLTLHI